MTNPPEPTIAQNYIVSATGQPENPQQYNIAGIIPITAPVNGITIGDPGSIVYAPPPFTGTFIAQNNFISTYTDTHSDYRSTVNIARIAAGSGQGPGGAQDIGAFISVQKTNYLTSAVAGDNGALYLVSQQGKNGDSAPLQAAGFKVYDLAGDGGITGIQAASVWTDASGNFLQQFQTVAAWSVQHGAYPLGGVGMSSESWGATASVSANQIIPYALYYGGVLDIFNDAGAGHPPYATNFIVASNGSFAASRGTANEYFKVVAGLNEAGDIVIGSASAKAIDGITNTQSGGNQITLKNISGGLAIVYGALELFALTSQAQIVLDSPGNTAGIFMYGANGNYVLTQPVAPGASYNFNLPNSPGSAGNVLLSQGGGSTAMTWSTGLTVDGSGNINTTGVYSVSGTQVVESRRTGWTVATGTPSRATFATGGVTLATLAGVVMALEQDLIAHGLIGT